MKKGLILVLAALMLAVSLTACAATQPYYDGYSNVSTTRNGYVNGTNNIGAFSDSYSKIRYDDEPATAEDILLSDSLINELYK